MKKIKEFFRDLFDCIDDIQFICFLCLWPPVLVLLFALPENKEQIISPTRQYIINVGLVALSLPVAVLIITSLIKKMNNGK